MVLGDTFDLVLKALGHYLKKIFKGTIKIMQLVPQAFKPGPALLRSLLSIFYLFVYLLYFFNLSIYFGFQEIEFYPLHVIPSISSLPFSSLPFYPCAFYFFFKPMALKLDHIDIFRKTP